MTDQYNLLFNGSLSSTTGWKTNSALSISNNEYTIGATWDTLNNYLIPVNPGDTYKISMDIDNTSGSNYCYICIYCYDNSGTEVTCREVEHSGNTTLAQALNNGDTTVYLTSVSGWYTDQTYRYVGICDSDAWGYGRCIYQQKYNSSSISTSTNTLTLQSAWAGGTWAAGTRVAAFTDGGTYIYPIVWTANTSQGSWISRSGNFTVRASTQYIKVGVGCYSGNSYKLRNLRIENISEQQTRIPCEFETLSTGTITKNGIYHINDIYEGTMPVRYIKDYVNGSDYNGGSHWCEIQAFNYLGVNVAKGSTVTGLDGTISIYNRSPNNNSNSYFKKGHAITQGSPTYSYAEGCNTLQVDLGSVFPINKLKIWHYYDGRTYNYPQTWVSADAVTWYKVYDYATQGLYVETSAGKEIILGKPDNFKLQKGQISYCNEIIEY